MKVQECWGGGGGIAVHKCSMGQATSESSLSSSEPASVVVPRQPGLSCLFSSLLQVWSVL